MTYDQIIAELRAEKAKIEAAVHRLLEIANENENQPRPREVGRDKARRGSITPAGRRKLSLAMKRRWASGAMRRQ